MRGRVEDDLDEHLAHNLGVALVNQINARRVVVGRDIRASSPMLLDALADGIQAAGADVIDIGLCGTEEVYFATDHFATDAGVMVTASHNPIDYNGFKMVGRGAAPVPQDTFRQIGAATAKGDAGANSSRGTRRAMSCRDAYVEKVCSFVEPDHMRALHILVNAGNGCAGPAFDAIFDILCVKGAPLRATRLHHDPDPTFPNGIPNPLLPENQPTTSNAVLQNGADFGIAWDGDFDRCFFFDEKGDFIAGEYIVGILAAAILTQHPGAHIVHDPRIIWNTQRLVTQAGGHAVMSKTGHAFLKASMRAENAVYGGEMSAHHYFRDFMFCDSGMIPWVLMLAWLSNDVTSLKHVVDDMRARHPSSGEINFRVENPQAAIAAIHTAYADKAETVDWLDGLSMAFEGWRFNLRASNTEPLLRLNVEAVRDAHLMQGRTNDIAEMIQAL